MRTKYLSKTGTVDLYEDVMCPGQLELSLVPEGHQLRLDIDESMLPEVKVTCWCGWNGPDCADGGEAYQVWLQHAWAAEPVFYDSATLGWVE